MASTAQTQQQNGDEDISKEELEDKAFEQELNQIVTRFQAALKKIDDEVKEKGDEAYFVEGTGPGVFAIT